MIQSFRKIKIDPTDTLYSKIIRFGKLRCESCGKAKALQCAHIMGRGHIATRWALKPYRNAIALCADCHSWFDSCKDDTPIFNEEARPHFKQDKNAYAFLVERCDYSWDDLYKLYALAHHGYTKCGKFEKAEIREQLKQYLKQLEDKDGKRNS